MPIIRIPDHERPDELRMQNVAALVSFRDEQEKLHVVLVRTDPRYHDFMGACLRGAKLSLGAFKFAGGRQEFDIDDHAPDAWNWRHPYLMRELHQPGLDNGNRKLLKLAGLSAMRELAEEISLPFDSMGLLSRARLRLLKKESGTSPYGQLYDTYYLNLDLGTLSRAQVDYLKDSIAPKDDTIATVIIAADKLQRDGNGDIRLRAGDGIAYRVKRDFSGFPELPVWDERSARRIAHGGHPGIAFGQGNMRKISETIRGMQGIDETTLGADQLLDVHRGYDNGHSNSHILDAFLKAQETRSAGSNPPLFAERATAETGTVISGSR